MRNRRILLLCFSLLLLQHALAIDEDRSIASPSQSTAKAAYRLLDSEKKSDNLPDANTSVEFGLSFIDSPLLDIIWCGSDKQTILVLSDKGTVYSTKDLGKTWNKLREIFQKTGKKTAKDEEDVMINLLAMCSNKKKKRIDDRSVM